jgi:hypothetical protein
MNEEYIIEVPAGALQYIPSHLLNDVSVVA